MHCQRQVSQQVVEQGGDYALSLKGNQGTLHDDVKLFLDDPDTPVAQATRSARGTDVLKPALPASAPISPGCKSGMTGPVCRRWAR